MVVAGGRTADRLVARRSASASSMERTSSSSRCGSSSPTSTARSTSCVHPPAGGSPPRCAGSPRCCTDEAPDAPPLRVGSGRQRLHARAAVGGRTRGRDRNPGYADHRRGRDRRPPVRRRRRHLRRGATQFFRVLPEPLHPSDDVRRRTIGLCVEHPGTDTFEWTLRTARGLGACVDINDDSTLALHKAGIAVERFTLGYSDRWDRWGGAPNDRSIDVVYLGTTDTRRSRFLTQDAEVLDDRSVVMAMPPHEPMVAPPARLLHGRRQTAAARRHPAAGQPPSRRLAIVRVGSRPRGDVQRVRGRHGTQHRPAPARRRTTRHLRCTAPAPPRRPIAARAPRPPRRGPRRGVPLHPRRAPDAAVRRVARRHRAAAGRRVVGADSATARRPGPGLAVLAERGRPGNVARRQRSAGGARRSHRGRGRARGRRRGGDRRRRLAERTRRPSLPSDHHTPARPARARPHARRRVRVRDHARPTVRERVAVRARTRPANGSPRARRDVATSFLARAARERRARPPRPRPCTAALASGRPAATSSRAPAAARSSTARRGGCHERGCERRP